MGQYLKAENLKCRRIFAKKLVLIAPLLTVLLSGISSMYLVQNGYNWWYTIIFPGFITLTTALIKQIEEKNFVIVQCFHFRFPCKKSGFRKFF